MQRDNLNNFKSGTNDTVLAEVPLKVLLLTLHRAAFEVMVTGEKKEEFRKGSQWIINRLFDKNMQAKEYDLIKFVNGYGSDKPFFTCRFEGFLDCYMPVATRKYSNGLIVSGIGKGDFIIYCGQIVEIGNW